MSVSLEQIAEFLWLEADILDRKDYASWLDLWDEAGLYVVPIDRDDGDPKTRLNYAYDDAAMRSMRVRRLTSGQSISAASAAVTVRSVSRFRRLSDLPNGDIRVSCAQHLAEVRKGQHRPYASDVTFTLRAHGDSYRIVEKTVLLANSTESLAGITFLP